MKSKRNITEKIVWSLVFAFLVLYTIMLLSLLIWGFNTSLKSDKDFLLFHNVFGFPDSALSANELKFGNYLKVLNNFTFSKRISYWRGNTRISYLTESGFLDMLLNTIVFAGVGAFLKAVFPMTVAYCCAKYKFVSSKIITAIVVFAMILPVTGSEVSTVNLLRTLGLYDTRVGLLLPTASFLGMYFLVFLAFFESLSDSYKEAAEIDGASQTRVFINIMVPLCAKTIATIFLIQFIHLWNNYQTALVYSPGLPTLSYAVFYLGIKNPDREMSVVPVQIASQMILAVPILIVFIIFRRRIMGGVSLGGIKE